MSYTLAYAEKKEKFDEMVEQVKVHNALQFILNYFFRNTYSFSSSLQINVFPL